MFLVAVVPAAWSAWRLLEQDRVLASEWLREVMDRRADEVVQSLSRAVAALVKDVRGLPPGTAKALGDSPGMPVQPRLLPEAPTEISRRTGGIPLASLRRVDRFLSQADRAVSATARQVREYF